MSPTKQAPSTEKKEDCGCGCIGKTGQIAIKPKPAAEKPKK